MPIENFSVEEEQPQSTKQPPRFKVDLRPIEDFFVEEEQPLRVSLQSTEKPTQEVHSRARSTGSKLRKFTAEVTGASTPVYVSREAGSPGPSAREKQQKPSSEPSEEEKKRNAFTELEEEHHNLSQETKKKDKTGKKCEYILVNPRLELSLWRSSADRTELPPVFRGLSFYELLQPSNPRNSPVLKIAVRYMKLEEVLDCIKGGNLIVSSREIHHVSKKRL